MSPRPASPGTWAVRAILLSALVKGLVLAVLIPPFQTPDEYGHYDYVLYLSRVPALRFLTGDLARPERLVRDLVMTREVVHLADATGTLPHLREAILPVRDRSWTDMFERAGTWREGNETDLAEAVRLNALLNYPPLYHGAVALGVRGLRALGVNPLLRFYSARFASLACFLLTLVVTAHLLAVTGWPTRVTTAILATLAWQPQLSMLSVSVQPDNLGLLLVTGALVAIVRFARQPTAGRAVALGALTGLVLLTKTHYVPPLAAATAVAALIVVARRQATLPDVVRRLAVAVAMTAVVGGWWHVRSRLLYGNWAGFVAFLPAEGSGTFVENLRAWWAVSVPFTFRSYWGMWGWFDYGIAPWALPWLTAISLAPAWLLAVRAVAPPPAPTGDAAAAQARVALWILAAATTVFAAEIVAIGGVMGAVQNQGRHWLAFAVPEMLYLSAPLVLCIGRSRESFVMFARRHARTLEAGLTVALAAALVCLSAMLVDGSHEAWLEVRLRLRGADGQATLLYDTGVGLNAVDLVSRELRKRDGWTTRRFPIGGRELRDLRLDVNAPGGVLEVSSARIVSAGGRELAPVSSESLVVLSGPSSASEGGLVSLGPSTTTLSVRIPFERPVPLPGGFTSAVVDPLRWFWHRLYRRLPLTRTLAPAGPTMLILAASLWWMLRLRGDAGRPVPPASRLFPAAYPVLHIAITLLLAMQTWRFYRP